MPPSKPKSPGAIENLLSILDLEPLEDNLFRGRSPQQAWQRVFGGQVLGQAWWRPCARCRPSASPIPCTPISCCPAISPRPIIYDVERVRDGGSFTTRRVTATQHGRAMFVMSVSFHKAEPGLDHQNAMPDVPPPEDLPSEADLSAQMIARAARQHAQLLGAANGPSRCGLSTCRATLRARSGRPVQHVWMRASGRLPDDAPLHQCVLAYASDFSLLDTALIAHGKLMFDKDIQLASLDHALWYHRPFRADDWLLYAQDSPSSHGARGFCRGSIFTRDGALVASVAQEGLMRQRASDFVPR